MSKFRQAMGSLVERGHHQGMLLAVVADEVSGGAPPACLQGHLALAYGLIDNEWSDFAESGDYLIENIGSINSLYRADTQTIETAEQYVADCKLLARIIVEQFSDRLKYQVPIYEEVSENGRVVHRIVADKMVEMYEGEDYDSWETMIEVDPHSIIANFNDDDETTAVDCLLVLEKAAIQGDEFVMFAEEMNAEFAARA